MSLEETKPLTPTATQLNSQSEKHKTSHKRPSYLSFHCPVHHVQLSTKKLQGVPRNSLKSQSKHWRET